MFQLPAHTNAKYLSSSLSGALADIISCDRWPYTYQQRNTLKPLCMETMTYGMLDMVSPGTLMVWPRQPCHEQCNHTNGVFTQDLGRWLLRGTIDAAIRK